jgi:hypothetical protein
MNNNVYDLSIKNEFINMINRINYIDKNILHYENSLDYVLLINTLNEELKFIINRKKYFSINLQKDIRYIMKEFFNNRIIFLKKQINKFN